MTSMKERRERAQKRIDELLERAPDGVDRETWLRDQLGLEDVDSPDGVEFDIAESLKRAH
ncbi:hypothetical protein NL64_06255 [Pseudomonas fluorescens]|nr:hypothetical protein NL64_06255 [Pseudomonas fluorescens]